MGFGMGPNMERTLGGCFGRGSKLMVPFFWACAPPILVCFSGDRDVPWGYDLDFDPWPCQSFFPTIATLGLQEQASSLGEFHPRSCAT